MKKLRLISSIFVSMIGVLFFSSCDSLWQIEETKQISVQFTIPSKILLSTISNTGNGDDEPLLASVLLKEEGSMTVLQEKAIEIIDNNYTTLQVKFSNLTPNLNVYAIITVTKDDTVHFSAQSLPMLLQPGKINILETRPNAVFVSNEGKEDAVGYYSASPVNSITKAIEILGGKSSLRKHATVYVMDTLELTKDFDKGSDIDLRGLRILPFSKDSTDALLSITVNTESPPTLTLGHL